jgi:hypothetical protein
VAFRRTPACRKAVSTWPAPGLTSRRLRGQTMSLSWRLLARSWGALCLADTSSGEARAGAASVPPTFRLGARQLSDRTPVGVRHYDGFGVPQGLRGRERARRRSAAHIADFDIASKRAGGRASPACPATWMPRMRRRRPLSSVGASLVSSAYRRDQPAIFNPLGVVHANLRSQSTAIPRLFHVVDVAAAERV